MNGKRISITNRVTFIKFVLTKFDETLLIFLFYLSPPKMPVSMEKKVKKIQREFFLG